jgi:antirestriction protein ArdC
MWGALNKPAPRKDAAMAGRDVHQEVTDRIVEALEKGTAPWVKPWNGSAGLPVNATTNKAYNGVNVFLCWLTEGAMGYGTSRWLTFKQAKNAGGSVMKGEKGTGIVFFNWREYADKADPSKKKKIPLLRFYTVFNVGQCEGLSDKVMGKVTTGEELPESARLAHAEAWLGKVSTSMGIVPTRHGTRACYIPSMDEIRLPPFSSFVDAASAYSVEAHEFAHATGSEKRLKRDLSGSFGGESYAAEELVAEMTSAFVCAQLGLAGKLQHPEYIGNWIKVLKGNTRALFTAASLAKKAHAYLAEAAGEPLPGFTPKASDEDEEGDD